MNDQAIKSLVAIGAFSMGIAVILGALGAHALENSLSPESLDSFKTGVRYQAWHSLAIIILGLGGKLILKEKQVKIVARLFIAGIVMFSLSIYLLSCKSTLGIESWISVIGPITPLGGLLLIAAWFALGAMAISKKA
ncbi:MAG: DUF423 domain-containing protein [Bacteroidota bacterium]